MKYPTVEEFIETLKQYPKDTEVRVHVYDMGDVYHCPPEVGYYSHQNALYIFPGEEDEIDEEV